MKNNWRKEVARIKSPEHNMGLNSVHKLRLKTLIAGAKNLLLNCVKCKANEKLLIVRETRNLGYYSDDLPDHIHRVAFELGMHVTILEVPFDPCFTEPDANLQAHMDVADHVLFLARVGDQIRFRKSNDAQKLVVSYALDEEMLESPFGAIHYDGFLALKALVDNALNEADTIRVTCPEGTDFAGPGMKRQRAAADTTLKRFPLSVFSPVRAGPFSGVVAQRGFLVGTGSTFYEPYACEITDLLRVRIDQGRIAGFEGSPTDVETAKKHYHRIGQSLGVDQGIVHSWHAGIHPGCDFRGFAGDNFERWSGGAFGNPRLLHLHTCGDYAPGEISLNVLDPTITIDGIAVWERGRLHPERIAGGAEILGCYAGMREAFASPAQNVGLGPDGALAFGSR